MKSEVVPLKYHQAIFTWHSGNKLQGMIAAHVDDFCFARSEIFQKRVIDRLRHVFAVKSEEVAEFQYIGLDKKKNSENIKLSQNEHVKKLFQ